MVFFIISENQMSQTFKGWDNLATVKEIRKSAWLTWNTDIDDEYIETYREKARWDVWTYVAWRYDLKSFTEERFMKSLSFAILRGCQILLASSYIMNEWYWSQRLEEDNGSWKKYDQQMAILDDLRKWNTRLLDVNNDEFDLLPLSPNKTPPSSISSSFDNNCVPRDFRTSDRW